MRLGFKMKLHEGCLDKYEKRHNPIWQELEDLLYKQGVKTYSIFHDMETNILFGYAEVENLENWNDVANTEICKKWWVYMAPLMEVNKNNSPVSIELKEVFHIQNKN